MPTYDYRCPNGHTTEAGRGASLPLLPCLLCRGFPWLEGARIRSRMRQMSEGQAAWVGAMIEGEGHTAYPNGKHRHSKVVVANSDPEVISALLRFTGTGTVSLQSHAGRDSRGIVTNKPTWAWDTSRRAEIWELIQQCRQWSPKLQKLEVAVAAL